MTMTPDKMEWVIRRMSDGLPYVDERRDRIAMGSRYLFSQIKEEADTVAQAKVMNKYILPVFVRLVWESHRMDIPVETYAAEVQSIMDTVLMVDAEGGMNPPDVVSIYPELNDGDQEVLLLTHLSNEIKVGFDKLYPLDVA